MIIHNVEQNTEEWFRVRAGIPTASAFDKIITPGGKQSTSADKYENLLISELLTGKPTPEGFKSPSMMRGNVMEEEAANGYAFKFDIEPVRVGFVTDSNRTMGCSPDRLIGDDGLLEIKCPEAHTHVAYLLDEKLDREYWPQVQGQLLVTGRKWCDIITYYPEMPLLTLRVTRDEAYLADLRRYLKLFHESMERKKQILEAKGYKIHNFGNDNFVSPLDAC